MALERRLTRRSRTRHLHAVHQNRAHGFGTVVVGVSAHGLNAHEHVFEVAGDGDFFHRKGDLAVLNPEARSATGIITRHVVHALAHQFGDEQAAAELIRLQKAIAVAVSQGLRTNAGHGLHFGNVAPIAALPGIAELNIGHAIVAQAIFDGWENTIRNIKACMIEARLNAQRGVAAPALKN